MSNIFYAIAVPLFMILFFGLLHYYLLYRSYRREIKQDQAREIKLNQLLSETGCENEELNHPATWEVYAYKS